LHFAPPGVVKVPLPNEKSPEAHAPGLPSPG